jgi:hypothetical protein
MPWQTMAELNALPTGSSSSIDISRVIIKKHNRIRSLPNTKSHVSGREKSGVRLHEAEVRGVQERVKHERSS